MANEREIDRLLVDRIQKGDKECFNVFISKYQGKLLRLVLRFVHNPVEAEDLVQDIFIKAYKALDQFRGDSAFYTWLYRIALNTARNFLEEKSKKEAIFQFALADENNFIYENEVGADINTPESLLSSKQIAQTVNLAINDLQEDLRLALILRELEGLSYEEIAIAMNCPIGTVRSRIFRAREVIASKLRPLLGTHADKRW